MQNKKLIIGSAISGKWDPRSVTFGRIRVARPGTHLIGGTWDTGPKILNPKGLNQDLIPETFIVYETRDLGPGPWLWVGPRTKNNYQPRTIMDLLICCMLLSFWKVYWSVFRILKCRSSHRRCSVRKGVHRNFAKFAEKHLCQSLLFNNVAGLRPGTGVFLWLLRNF